MSETESSVNRRDFMKSAAAVGVTLAAAKNIWPQSGSKASPGRVIGANGPASEEKREVPDTFHVMAEFPSKHSLVLSSTMANSRHIPGLIRGRLGTITMVDNGMFDDAHNDHITLSPERRAIDDAYRAKFGDKDMVIPVEDTLDKVDALHMTNFLDCVRSRQELTLDVETAYDVQVTISMSVQAYREGRVLYWNARNQEVVPAPPEA